MLNKKSFEFFFSNSKFSNLNIKKRNSNKLTNNLIQIAPILCLVGMKNETMKKRDEFLSLLGVKID